MLGLQPAPCSRPSRRTGTARHYGSGLQRRSALALPTRIFSVPTTPAMKKYACALILLQGSLLSSAQNLVPNGSFEEYTECPDFWNQVDRAVGWYSAGLSPDYFNACSTTGYVGVPQSVVGFQAAWDGSAYAGGYSWCAFPPNRREFLSVELVEPLVPGEQVELSMRIAAATGGSQENMRWSIGGVGMRFSVEPYVYDQVSPLPNNAALFMESAPADTSIWYWVHGEFMPDSAYRYLTIGNMFDDAHVQPIIVNEAAAFDCSYFFVDDVCVSTEASACIVAALPELSQSKWVMRVFPNPAITQLRAVLLSGGGVATEVSIQNVLGERVAVAVLKPWEVEVQFALYGYPAGVYRVSAQSNGITMCSRQFVIISN